MTKRLMCKSNGVSKAHFGLYFKSMSGVLTALAQDVNYDN